MMLVGNVWRYETYPEDRIRAANRRAELTAQGLCINGASHGDATHGVLCRKCRARHRGVPIEDVAEVPRPA